jgi:hypothetical protein
MAPSTFKLNTGQEIPAVGLGALFSHVPAFDKLN